MAKIYFNKFASLKGEFEAEGLSREEVAVEALYASRNGIDYLVKIGGCEAKSDVHYLERLGIRSVVAPMIESPFAMEKYMEMLPAGAFDHIGVTIETITAVERIEQILTAGANLSDVTIGRSDLTASFRGTGVDAPETIEMVKAVAKAAGRRGLAVTMGGGVNVKTRELLRSDRELAKLVGYVETRKVVMPVESFVQPGILEAAIEVELELLKLRSAPVQKAIGGIEGRIGQIKERI